jgi:putative flippase GtrA
VDTILFQYPFHSPFNQVVSILRPQSFTRKISWFTVVGLIAAILYVIATVFFEKFMGFGPQLASGLGVLLSALFSYLGHYHLTFLVEGRHRVHGTRFVLQIAVTMVLNAAFIQLSHNTFGLPLWLSTTIFSVVMPVVNFVIYQIYTFRPHRGDS